jgi:hypothetical protein
VVWDRGGNEAAGVYAFSYIKGKLESELGKAYYHSFLNSLSSRLRTYTLNRHVYEYTLLSVVLHGCETRSLSLWEEHRLRVFENRMRRRIFGPKRVEVMGVLSGLHNEAS